jgi:hypothetical protein
MHCYHDFVHVENNILAHLTNIYRFLSPYIFYIVIGLNFAVDQYWGASSHYIPAKSSAALEI